MFSRVLYIDFQKPGLNGNLEEQLSVNFSWVCTYVAPHTLTITFYIL